MKAISYFLFVFFLLFSGIAAAKDLVFPEVERKPTSGELAVNEEFSPVLGISQYDVYLREARIGKATIEVSLQDGQYLIKVNAKVIGTLGSLYKVSYSGEVQMNSDPIEPKKAFIVEKTGSKKKSYDIEFPSADKAVVVKKVEKGKKTEELKVQNFDSESFVLDPFSIVYLIRSFEWEENTAEVFDVVTGNRHYELILYCSGETVLDIGGEKWLAWMIHPEARTLDEQRKVKLSNWTLYLSKDETKQILRIKGYPKIGRITANLRHFEEKDPVESATN